MCIWASLFAYFYKLLLLSDKKRRSMKEVFSSSFISCSAVYYFKKKKAPKKDWFITNLKVTDETVCKENNGNNSYLLIIGHFVTFGCIQEPTSLL